MANKATSLPQILWHKAQAQGGGVTRPPQGSKTPHCIFKAAAGVAVAVKAAVTAAAAVIRKREGRTPQT